MQTELSLHPIARKSLSTFEQGKQPYYQVASRKQKQKNQ